MERIGRAELLSILTIALLACHRSSSSPPEQREAAFEWTRLTESNFSADIHTHAMLLCVATVPWCGESKAVMVQLLKSMEMDFQFWSQLQLRFIYINVDKRLGAILSGTRTPTLILYRDAIPYRYSGKLTVNNILAGIRYGITISSMDLPLTRLNSFPSLKDFTDSTDKAVILFDLCKWASRISENWKQENVEEHFHENVSNSSHEKRPLKGDDFETSQECNQETQDAVRHAYSFLSSDVSKDRCEDLCTANHEMGTPDEEIDHKRLNEAELCSNISSELETSCLPWSEASGLQSIRNTSSNKATDYISTNEIFKYNISAQDSNRGDLESGFTCSWENYKQFEGFYMNFTKFAASHLLTPEREKYGIVTDVELAVNISLSIQISSLWFLMMQTSDKVSDPKFFFGGEGLEEFILSSPQLVRELDRETLNDPSLLLNDTPSVILFIDRTSTSYEMQKRSKELLHTFHAVAKYYMPINPCESDLIASSVRGLKDVKTGEDDFEKMIKAKGQLKVHFLDFFQMKKILSSNSHSSMKDGSDVLSSKEIRMKGNQDAEHAHALLRLILEVDNAEIIVSSSSVSEEDDTGVSQFSKSDLPKSFNAFHRNDVTPVYKIISSESVVHDQAVRELDKGFSVLEEIENGSTEDLHLRGGTDDPFASSKAEETSEKRPAKNDSSEQQKKEQSSDSLHISINNDETSDMVIKYDKREESSCLISSNLLNSVSHFVVSEMCLRWNERGNDTPDGDEKTITQGKNDEQISNIDAMHLFDYSLFNANYSENTTDNVEDIGKPGCLKETVLLSFFFVDGDDELKETLTMKKSTSSLILVDPLQHESYIFPVDQSLSKPSMVHFVDGFLEGSLQRTLRSEKPSLHSRKDPQPVHEFVGTPRVTVDTFSQMVMGYSMLQNKSNSKDLMSGDEECLDDLGISWNKDVLVLFTVPWCSFCKRMELVVWEVYRSLHMYVRFNVHYTEDRKFGSTSRVEFDQTNLVVESVTDDDESDLPVLLQMDCMTNECHHIFRHIHQDQEYPTIILFPAAQKDYPIKFDGIPTVHAIFKFLAEHGNAASKTLYSLEGHLWDRTLKQDCFTVPEPLLIESTVEEMHTFFSYTTENSNFFLPEAVHYPVVGSVLIASEKLSKLSPMFDNSIILIFKVDMHEGIKGLILNKPLSLKSLVELPSGLAGLPSDLKPILELSFLSYGGPVVLQGLPFLCLTYIEGLEGFSEVAPGLYFGDLVSTANIFQLIRDSKLDARKFHFFLGHAVWGWQQLQDEVLAHLWSLELYRKDMISLLLEDDVSRDA